MKIKHSVLVFSFFLLFGCQSDKTDKKEIKMKKEPTKDINTLNLLVGQIANNIEKIWGRDELLIAGPKDYVQYDDELRTRVHINFVSGKIIIETLEPSAALYDAIVQTLLMGEPDEIIGSPQEYNPAQVPFLYHQVLDQQGEPIRWRWRAENFAAFLTANKIKSRKTKNGERIQSIEINLVPNHVHERALKFMPFVTKHSHSNRLEPKLVLAIIEVESNFNPFAVSRSDALGLMQVQQHTAGRDLHARWNKKGEPSRAFLLDPDNNIMMGSAYLALIRDQYLPGIRHPKSRDYAMMAAYNGGAGSVMRLFSSDRKKAIEMINQLTPEAFFNKLTTKHPSEETRNYIKKVTAIMNR